MLKHSQLLDIKTLLRSLCVVTVLLTAFCHPVNAQEQVPLDDGVTNNNTTNNDQGNDIEGDFSNNYEDSTVESNNISEVINYNGAGS